MYADLKAKNKKRLSLLSNTNRLANFVISMFETTETDTNPFYKNWEFNDFESNLLYYGVIAIWYDDIEENYVFSHVDFIGNIDFQGIGKDANCTTENGHNKVFKNWRNNKEVVIIFNNSNHSPDLNIERYADLQNETWISIDCGVKGTRYNKLISVSDEKTRIGVENAINSCNDGKPMLAMSSNLNIFENNENSINSVKLTDFNESDKIQYLSALSTWIERDFINKYGMASQGMDKIAQQNTEEIKNGAFSSWVEVLSRLKERKEGFEKVKEYFGLDIPYDFSNVWKKEYERLFENKGVLIDENTGNDEPNPNTQQS